MTVLVAYASRHGATQGIATRLADRLTNQHVGAELCHVDDVGPLGAYSAVVLGAPVYDQSWPEEFDRFLSRSRDELAAGELWLFSVGAFGDTNRVFGRMVRREPSCIGGVLAWAAPKDYRVFKGVIRTSQWPFWSRVAFRAVGGRFGDHRDWPTIDAWADEIVRTVQLAAPKTQPKAPS